MGVVRYETRWNWSLTKLLKAGALPVTHPSLWLPLSLQDLFQGFYLHSGFSTEKGWLG